MELLIGLKEIHFKCCVSPGGSVVKNPPANVGDTKDAGLIPGLGRFPREGNGNPSQYSCLENSKNREAWWASVHRVAKNQTQLIKWTWIHILAVKSKYHGTPLQYSCLENPMDGGAWWAAVHGVAKSWTRLGNFTFTFHALEKEVATHSSVLAWRIPGMREPGGLPSMGSHRVGHDWSDLAAAAAHRKHSIIGRHDFPGGSDGEESSCSVGDLGLIPGLGRSLEGGMATHSSILAWRISGTEEPSGLPSMGSHRVGHDWSDLAAAATGLPRWC